MDPQADDDDSDDYNNSGRYDLGYDGSNYEDIETIVCRLANGQGEYWCAVFLFLSSGHWGSASK